MPSNQNPYGALPARFRRQRVLIVGCGDVGARAARALPPRVRVLALARSPDAAQALRQQAIVPLAGDLDDPASLDRLAGIATHVLHLAPPPAVGEGDPRTAALLRARQCQHARARQQQARHARADVAATNDEHARAPKARRQCARGVRV